MLINPEMDQILESPNKEFKHKSHECFYNQLQILLKQMKKYKFSGNK